MRPPLAGKLEIHLYFEPDTFHHVLTVYRLEKTVDEGGEAQASNAGTQTTTVEERFDDFRQVDGLTLPFAWDIRLRVEPSSKAQEFEWKVALIPAKPIARTTGETRRLRLAKVIAWTTGESRRVRPGVEPQPDSGVECG